jgi:hypothetical protein
MYQIETSFTGQSFVCLVANRAFIPFDLANTDYQQFKRDIQNGVVLNDAEGNPITGAALTTFIGTLP